MFRRSRFSVRPNIGTVGRTAATPQEAPSESQEASETPKDVTESSTATAVTDNKSAVTPSEKPTATGDDQSGEGTSSSAAVQRRKRFAIKPRVAPGRPSTLTRTPKSPVKALSESPVKVSGSDLDKPTTASQTATAAAPPGLQSPRRRRPSEDSKQPKVQPKPTLVPSDSSEPSAVPPAEDSPEKTPQPTDGSKKLESTSSSQIKEVPPRLPDKVPPSLPDREAVEISEKAKTLVSSKSGLSLSQPAYTLSRLLNDPSDLQRLAKARKLRELLREEMHKEKKIKKAKARPKEYTLDPAKMTMRDLIRYLPMSNPMSSSLETAPENETVVPPSPGREESPERAQEPAATPKIGSPTQEDVEEAAEEDQEEALMVPQVKVAEDGSLIIDEESLTVEVQRAKGPNTIQDRDPIFERGSTTTYSSFRKGTYSKPWTSEETDMFFLAISMVGTDFSMICQLFPHRARSEIKNKFKKEERENAWRIDKAFRERRKLDIEYFSKLLEKILEVQKNRKKLKSLAEKNSHKKPKKKAKGKKAASKLSDVEEEDEEEMPDLEGEEGEKENEGGTPVSKPKAKRKRKAKQDGSEPDDKRNKKNEKGNEQDEADIPEDTEAALPEDHTNSDISEKTENTAKGTAIKPAKLSRGRAPKPLLPLGRKWGKKTPAPSTKAKDSAADEEDENVNKDTSPTKEASKGKSADDDILSEEEDATVQPPKPTRYGRVPKPTKPLNYPAKDNSHSSASETSPGSPAGSSAAATKPKPKATAKRGRSSKAQSARESKKPKLVTLRASQSEDSDEENEAPWEDVEINEEQLPSCSISKDGVAPAFVPASLRSPPPVISEVEETMEELDILANMPDVLGISQDALCPDSSFELAQNETGTTEPCEHQLDLLVDVIDFLSSEHTEVSEDESYNEAAQTLLTIGNMAHLSQSAQSQADTQDHTAEATSVNVYETIQYLEEDIAAKPAEEESCATSVVTATSGEEVTETSETVATNEVQNSTDSGAIPSDHRTGSDIDPTPCVEESPEGSKKNSPQTRKGRLSRVKPKPNIGQSSRSAQSKSQPEIPAERTPEESHIVVPNLSQASETQSAAEETLEITGDHKEESSCIENKLTEEPSCSQEKSDGQAISAVAASDQSTSESQSDCLSDAKSEPSFEQANRDSTRESTVGILTTHVGTTGSSSINLGTSDTAVRDSQETLIDLAPVQQSNDHPTPPVEDIPVSQKEESEDAATPSTKKSRFQRVKPKPNLAKTSRTAQPKPQTTEDPLKKDSSPTQTSKFNEKMEVEGDATCATAPESQSTGPVPDISPDSCSTFAPTEELSTAEERKKDAEVVPEVESSVTTSDQSAVEKQTDAQFDPLREQDTSGERPTSEPAEEKLVSHITVTESSLSSLDSAVPESQVGHGSNIDSSDRPSPSVIPVEEPPVSQKDESEEASTCPTRKSRFQRVKPKPNLAQTSRTVRSKTQTTTDTVEKESSPTPLSKVHEKTTELEAQPTCTISPESQSPVPASDLLPSPDSASALILTEVPSSTEEKRADRQVESDAGTSDKSGPENQTVTEVLSEPSTEPTTRDARSTFETTDNNDNLMSPVDASESSSSSLQTSDSAILESHVQHESSMARAPIQESSDHPAPSVTTVGDLPASQKESEDASSNQTRKSRFQRVKPKPNLPQTSRAVRSKFEAIKDPVVVEKPSSPASTLESTDITITEAEAQPTCSTTSPRKPSQTESAGITSVSAPSLESCSAHKPAEELPSTEGQKIDVGSALEASSEGSEQNALQRRRRLPKVKPNLGSTSRTTQSKLQPKDTSEPSQSCNMDTSSKATSEQQPLDNNELTEKDDKLLAPAHCSSELLTSTASASVESEMCVDDTNDTGTSSDSLVIAASSVTEYQSMLMDSVLENKSSEKPTVEGKSTMDKEEAGPASQLDSRQEISFEATETNTQPTDDPTAITNILSPEDHSTESEIKSVKTQSTTDPRERTQEQHLKTESEAQSKDAVQQGPETSGTNQAAAQSTDNESECSRKAPLARRGRLVKPKPNLGRRSQPPQPQQVQNTKQAETDSAPCSEGVDASVSHQPVSEHRPDIQEPVEGAIEQPSDQSCPPTHAGSSLGSLSQVIEQPNQQDSTVILAASSQGSATQLPDNSAQEASTSSAGEAASQPCLTIFPDMLPEQMPSDPDEPFFILSLTEIPVGPSGDVLDPYLPVTDASVQQQSAPGESLAAAEDEPHSDVAVPVPTEESGETVITVKDTEVDSAAHTDSIMENPVDPKGITPVQPSILPETPEINDETEHPPTKQRVKSTGRTAKVPAKPKPLRKTQAGKTCSESAQDAELPGPSVQRMALDDDDHHEDTEKETVTSGKEAEDGSSGAQTTRTRRTGSRNSKPKGNTAPTSEPPSAKAASKEPKIKTPRAAGRRSKPAAAAPAPTPCDVTPTSSVTRQPEETHSTPSTTTQAVIDVEETSEHSRLHSDPTFNTSPSAAEVSFSQQSEEMESSFMEDEPTSVSQYFLSDIFTDVEEG